jgi:hypothetical protein
MRCRPALSGRAGRAPAAVMFLRPSGVPLEWLAAVTTARWWRTAMQTPLRFMRGAGGTTETSFSILGLTSWVSRVYMAGSCAGSFVAYRAPPSSSGAENEAVHGSLLAAVLAETTPRGLCRPSWPPRLAPGACARSAGRPHAAQRRRARCHFRQWRHRTRQRLEQLSGGNRRPVQRRHPCGRIVFRG